MEQHSPLRERLIDVGVDLVLTEGTAALGLREIARRAGVSHGAPRRYFPTHHSLLSAIARRGFADLGGRFAAATAGASSPREQVRALGCAYVGYALEHRGMFELMFRHDLLDSEGQEGAGQGESGQQPKLRESTLPLFRLLVGLVSRCRAGGDPEVTAAALWANLHGVAQLWAWGSLPLVLGDAAGHRAGVERLVDAALDAHLGAVTP
ncbi:TetR/AcrR family transcriptional regulator [Streptomyces sp. NBC_00320]|uniref:TetR/AcrR family transcriptional regulator n=1 Tax=unclassified Streptomyces TaxID=2593676 RepID=UPI002251395C|nr:TetR/AcrR family transcriptional regulator [Streptomyces sp. NBC_00320]MCX5151952.1 TetR/AcrR family transcriptional regulator [Streptomyces sp. NBC_00320]